MRNTQKISQAGVDLAKSVIQVHAVDQQSRKVMSSPAVQSQGAGAVPADESERDRTGGVQRGAQLGLAPARARP